MDLDLSIYNGTVSSNIYDLRENDDFEFDIVYLPFLDTSRAFFYDISPRADMGVLGMGYDMKNAL